MVDIAARPPPPPPPPPKPTTDVATQKAKANAKKAETKTAPEQKADVQTIRTDSKTQAATRQTAVANESTVKAQRTAEQSVKAQPTPEAKRGLDAGTPQNRSASETIAATIKGANAATAQSPQAQKLANNSSATQPQRPSAQSTLNQSGAENASTQNAKGQSAVSEPGNPRPRATAQQAVSGTPPGIAGVDIDGKPPTTSQLYNASKKNGVEYLLSYKKNDPNVKTGGNKQFTVYSGNQSTVPVPNDISEKPAVHTHPNDRPGKELPSREDVDTMQKRFQRRLDTGVSPNLAPETHGVVHGNGPGQTTPFRSGVGKDPAPTSKKKKTTGNDAKQSAYEASQRDARIAARQSPTPGVHATYPKDDGATHDPNRQSVANKQQSFNQAGANKQPFAAANRTLDAVDRGADAFNRAAQSFANRTGISQTHQAIGNRIGNGINSSATALANNPNTRAGTAAATQFAKTVADNVANSPTTQALANKAKALLNSPTGQLAKRVVARGLAPVALAFDAANISAARQQDIKNGDQNMTETKKAVAAAAGGWAGAASGAAIGAAVGTVVPVVGNIVGAVVGGIAGGIAGSSLGRYIGSWF